MGSSRSTLTHRVLRRLLSSGRGEVRAMEDALHIEAVLRLVLLLAGTVLFPALLLAYYGFSSIRVEQRDVVADVEREARGLTDAFWQSTDQGFSGLEQQVRDRLEAGRSPLEGRGELHPNLLVALRFDSEGQLVGPFVSTTEPDKPAPVDLFEPSLAEAAHAERSGASPRRVAHLYSVVSRSASRRDVSGRALFDRGRMLVKAGRPAEARAVFSRVEDEYATVRDPWGLRLGDIAQLERAELLLDDDPVQGTAALRDLIETMLASQWTVGHGGEAAIARRALSLYEPHGDREWAAMVRGRVAERNAMLYQTGQLLPELEALIGRTNNLRVDPGSFRWRAGRRALWATTWWDGDFYAFGLDRQAILEQLKVDARAAVLPDSDLVLRLHSPEDRGDTNALVEKSLAPWIMGWSVMALPRDSTALFANQARKRNQRVGVILLAVVMIGVGVFFGALLIKRELDVARMKADFASNVSHELRSPITQIRLKGEALLLGLADTPEEQERAFQAIVRESERLSRLVDNVLDFGAIERGAKSYTLRPGDLAESVYRAVDSIRSAQEVQDKEIEVDLPPDLPAVHHDADAVAQCVINLVSNAAKYSAPGAQIVITGQSDADGVDICVTDHGIGIAPHDVQHVFEPFFRSRSASARRRKGTGIGLTITHYIMQAHGGGVTVNSRLGRGSTFTLRFPIEPPPGAVLGGALGSSSPYRGA